MSKSKNIVLIAYILLIVGGVFFGLSLQERAVTVTSNTPVNLFSGDRKVTSIESTATLKLRDGEYCAEATESDYSKDKECFMVFRQDKEIALSISYSKEYLSSKLDEEAASLSSVITTTYAPIINSYTICRGELLTDGTWYGGILKDKVASLGDTGNYYYYIMKKESGWKLISPPSVVISKLSPEVKNVPENIIKKVTNLQPCESELTSPDNVPDNSVELFEFNRPEYTY